MQAGARISPRIKLLEALREGAMGSVWVAEDDERGERVAVKFVSRELLRDETARKRFRREAKLATEMTSRHVPKHYGHGETDEGTPYLIMELLEGETLADLLSRVGVLSIFEMLVVLEQVAEALDEAHEGGVVHRDIKPENIFLATVGDEAVVKVLDFGMAKRTGVSDPSVLTEAGHAVGTPNYMSPEQLRNDEDLDHRLDIWALGVVTYEALSGKLPFPSHTFAGLCVAICEGRSTPIREVDETLPASIDGWFARTLVVDAARRFATAREAVRAFKKIVSDEVERANPTPRAWGWWLVATALVVALGAVAALLTR